MPCSARPTTEGRRGRRDHRRAAARTGRATTDPGLVAADATLHPRRGGRRRRRPGRPGWPSSGAPGPSTWPSSSTTWPSTCCGSRRRRWPGRWWSGPTPPTGATSWPATSPTPTASCWSPRPAHLPLVDGPPARRRPSARSAATNPRVLVVDDPGVGGRARPHAGAPADPGRRRGHARDDLGYLIFTSGTSGAPKACRCTQGRLARIGAIVAQMFALTADDVCYLAMPLFHSNALMAGWGPALAAGATVALPTGGRFSASGFLPDVRRFGATYFNYVGKPLAYVLATPERPDDADNPLVRAFGNEGAEADVERFADRFGCAVTDAYGSTEGGAIVAAHPRHPARRAGPGPGGHGGARPGHRRRSARRPASTTRGRLLNAEEAIGELVSQGGGAGLRGLLAQRRGRAGPPARRLVLDRRPRLPRRGRASSTSPAGTTTGCGWTGRTSPPPRSSGSSSATPTSCWPPSTPSPTRWSATRSWPPSSCDPGRRLRSRGLRRASSPPRATSGPSGRPASSGSAEPLPVTATSKVLKRALRAERWNCDGPGVVAPRPGGPLCAASVPTTWPTSTRRPPHARSEEALGLARAARERAGPPPPPSGAPGARRWPGQRSTERTSPLVGTPVPAVTTTCSRPSHLVDRGAPHQAHRLGDAVHPVQVGLAQLAAVGVDGQPSRRARCCRRARSPWPRPARRTRAPRAGRGRRG